MPARAATAWIEGTLRRRIEDHPDRARAIGGVFELVIEGEGGGTWTLDLGAPDLRSGPAGRMNCRIRMAAEDFLALQDGRLDTVEAFREGRLKVEGNLALSLKLQDLVRSEGW